MATAKDLREYLAKKALAEVRASQRHSSVPPDRPAVTVTEQAEGTGCRIEISVRRALTDTELDFLRDDVVEKVRAFFQDANVLHV